MIHALGVDVSVSRDLDLVLIDEERRVVVHRRHQSSEDLSDLLRQYKPMVVAIDSPPRFGLSGRSREAERELMQRGIQIFATPVASLGMTNKFYSWMLKGHKAFEAADRAGYALYHNGSMENSAIEIFPHASAVVLKGSLPPAGMRRRTLKKAWRLAVLDMLGVETNQLRSLDEVDAALAALTALLAAQGEFTPIGRVDEGRIILPRTKLPLRFQRELG